jgi:hypothetical protein
MKRLEMSEAEILAVANSIMDNLMQAPTDIDHERHVRDFIEQLKAIVTKESLEAQHKEYQAKLGNFSEREFVAVYRKKRTLPSSENKSIKSPTVSTSRFFVSSASTGKIWCKTCL